jgi:hypothetical protein
LKPSTTRTLLLLVAAAALAGALLLVLRGRLPRPVRIVGRTVAAGGEPLSGVRVTLEISPSGTEEEMAVERVETRSDAHGEFSIDFQGHWRHASYRLEAEAPGYQKLSLDDADGLKNPVSLRLARAPS